jgi:hypothetical protein
MLSIANLDRLIDGRSMKNPEEARHKKLVRELSDFHAPRLMARLAATCARHRHERRSSGASWHGLPQRALRLQE